MKALSLAFCVALLSSWLVTATSLAAESSGRLSVTERPTVATPRKANTFQYLVITRTDDNRADVRRRFARRIRLDQSLPTGNYELTTYTRQCIGRCAGRLTGPRNGCTMTFDVGEGQWVRIDVVTLRRQPCLTGFVPAIEGQSHKDRAMAAQVRRYFARNIFGFPWYNGIKTIAVQNGVITVVTEVDLAADPFVGTVICDDIQGSDVADFTPGHAVLGSNGTQVTCQARELP